MPAILPYKPSDPLVLCADDTGVTNGQQAALFPADMNDVAYARTPAEVCLPKKNASAAALLLPHAALHLCAA